MIYKGDDGSPRNVRDLPNDNEYQEYLACEPKISIGWIRLGLAVIGAILLTLTVLS